MATTTIPWGDGSGDNIYLTYPSASGDQTVQVASDANTGSARSKIVTFSTGNISRQLTVNQEAGQVLPYLPADYIETAANAWLDTGILVNTRNFEMTLRMQWTGTGAGNFETFFGFMAAGSAVTPRQGFHRHYTRWMIGTNVTMYPGSIIADNLIHTFVYSGNATTQRESLTIDGTTYQPTGTTSASGLASNEITPYLGARNRNGSIDNPSYARFYSLNYKRFSDGAHNVLLDEYNFIPVQKNGVFGMWETISGTFHSSISGVEFTGQLSQ